MNDRIRQGLGTLNETARNMTRYANGGGINSLNETARDMNVYGYPEAERLGSVAAFLSQFFPAKREVITEPEFKWADDSVRFPFSLRELETDRGVDPETGKWVERGRYTPGEYGAPEYALKHMPIFQAYNNLQSALIWHLITPGKFERVVNIIKGAPSAIGNALIGQWAAMGADPGTAAKHPVTGEPEYGASLLPFGRAKVEDVTKVFGFKSILPGTGRAPVIAEDISKALLPGTGRAPVSPLSPITPMTGDKPPPTTMQMTQGGDEPPSLPSEKLLATTPVKAPAITEAVASWVVAPGVKGLTRESLIEQVGNNARTVKVLEDKGYKGNTVPIYRLIVSRGQSQPEGLISATLDPKKLSENIEFFTTGKLDLLDLKGTGGSETVSLARYDVPKEHLKLYVPDTINKMDNPAINKALAFVKERRAEGFEDIENPAEHARFLAEKQDEIIADVSGIDPKIYPISPLSTNFRSMDREILEGNIRSPEDFGNSTVLDFRQFRGSEDEFNVAEMAARRKKVKDVLNFFNPLATTPTKPLYHATFSKNIGNIKKEGFRIFGATTFDPGGQERQPGTFAFTDPTEALRWASKLNREFGEPVSVFKLKGGERWVPDPHPDPSHGSQASFYTQAYVPPEDILGVLDVGSLGGKEGIALFNLSIGGLTGKEDSAAATRALDLLQKLKNIGGETPPLPSEKLLATTPAKEPTVRVAYHGTRTVGGEFPKKADFGGYHFGTKKAAEDRLRDTPTGYLPPPRGPEPTVYSYKITLKKPYGTEENPITEQELYFLNAGVRSPTDGKYEGFKDLIKEGYDGVIYENIAEDPGSISYLVFDKKNVTRLPDKYVIDTQKVRDWYKTDQELQREKDEANRDRTGASAVPAPAARALTAGEKAPEEQLGLFEEAAQIKPQQLTAGSLFDEKKGRKLLIVGCCKTKSSALIPLPASERYIGTLFTTLKNTGVPEDVDVAVLSAKHGLIRLDTPLEDYNVTMKAGRKDLLKSPEQLARINNTVDGYDEVFVAGGKDYRNFLDEAGIKGKYTTYTDHADKVRGIGDQRSIFKKWLSGDTVPEATPTRVVTGPTDLTKGTRVRWKEPVFEGSFEKPRFVGTRTIEGTILKESYGVKRGQHTFTIEVHSAKGKDADSIKSKIRRKGRTVYKDAVVLEQPSNQAELAEEKHARAAIAKANKYKTWIEEAENDPYQQVSTRLKLNKIPSDWLDNNPEWQARIERLISFKAAGGGVNSLAEIARNMTRYTNGGGVNSLNGTARDMTRPKERLGSLTNRTRGKATALGPTIPMRIGGFLNPMLERVLDIFPKDNPYGSFLERLAVGSSPEKTRAMGEGYPHQYTGRGPNDPLINPEIVDLLAAVPAGTALKAATSAAPFLKAAAVPAGMLAASQALRPIAKGGRAADDMSGLVAAALQRQAAFDDAMVVYQGSPHKFDALDPTKIGTGEGAQAYGHGIYVAENPDTAKMYIADRSYVGRHMQGQPIETEFDAKWIAQTAVDEHGDNALEHLQNVLKQRSYSKNLAQKKANEQVKDAINMVTKGEVKRSGHFYEIDVPDGDIAKMLDWDAPLSEQPQSVQSAVRGLYDGDVPANNKYGERLTGADFHQRAVDRLSSVHGKKLLAEVGIDKSGGRPGGAQQLASEYLNALGIPGIKYYDQGSRAAGEGTRNMVLFEDLAKRAKVLTRDGIPLADQKMLDVLTNTYGPEKEVPPNIRKAIQERGLHPRDETPPLPPEELKLGQKVSVANATGRFFFERPLPNGWLLIREAETDTHIKVRKEDVRSAEYAGGGGVNSLNGIARNMTRYTNGGGVNSLNETARSMFV